MCPLLLLGPLDTGRYAWSLSVAQHADIRHWLLSDTCAPRLLLSLARPVWVGPVGAARLLFVFAHIPCPASHSSQLGESLAVMWEPLGSRMLKGLPVSFLCATNNFFLRFKEC